MVTCQARTGVDGRELIFDGIDLKNTNILPYSSYIRTLYHESENLDRKYYKSPIGNLPDAYGMLKKHIIENTHAGLSTVCRYSNHRGIRTVAIKHYGQHRSSGEIRNIYKIYAEKRNQLFRFANVTYKLTKDMIQSRR